MTMMTHEERAERRRQIAKAAAEGVEEKDLTARFSVSECTIRYACREAGVQPPPRSERKGNASPPSTYAILADLINTAATMQAIAARHRVTHQYVSLVYLRAKRAGIPVRYRAPGKPAKEER